MLSGPASILLVYWSKLHRHPVQRDLVAASHWRPAFARTQWLRIALTDGLEAAASRKQVGRHHVQACLATRNALHYNALHGLEDGLVDDQITVRLPASLGRTLRRTSRRLRRRPSDIVRMALDAFLQEAPPVDRRRAARVEDLIGSLSSGVPDLAERHREYVLASLKHGQ